MSDIKVTSGSRCHQLSPRQTPTRGGYGP